MNMYEILIEKAERLEQFSLKMAERNAHLSHRMRMKALELRRKAREIVLDDILYTPRMPLHY